MLDAVVFVTAFLDADESGLFSHASGHIRADAGHCSCVDRSLVMYVDGEMFSLDSSPDAAPREAHTITTMTATNRILGVSITILNLSEQVCLSSHGDS